MKIKLMLLVGLVLMLLMVLCNANAAPGDPTKFLNATNNATAWVGGNAGIVNATGNISTLSWFIGNIAWTRIQGVPSYLIDWTSTITEVQTNISNNNGTLTTAINLLRTDNDTQGQELIALRASNLSMGVRMDLMETSNSTQAGQIANLTGVCPPGEYMQNLSIVGPQCLALGGVGTVTSITFTGPQLEGGEITTTGIVNLNVSWLAIEFLNLTSQIYNETSLFDELVDSNTTMDGRMDLMELSNISQAELIDILIDSNTTQATDIANLILSNISLSDRLSNMESSNITLTDAIVSLRTDNTTQAALILERALPGSCLINQFGIATLTTGLTCVQPSYLNLTDTPTRTSNLPHANITDWPIKCATGEAVTNLSTGACSAFLTSVSIPTEYPATNVTAGTFGAGDYVFPANLTIDSNLLMANAMQISLNSTPTTGLYMTANSTCILIKGSTLTLAVC